MIRALFVLRQPAGGTAFFARQLAEALEELDIEVVIDEVSDWIPDRTGWQVDRTVSKKLRDAGKGFDVIIPFGYRAAWACGEAFYLKKPWAYVAYDTPRTTHQQLIDRLSSARAGICCSRTTKRVLDDADAVNLEVVIPGLKVPQGLPTKQAVRADLGLREDARIVVCMGRAVSDSGLDAFDDIVGMLKEEVPRLEGLVLPVTGEPNLKNCRLMQKTLDPWHFLQAADLVIVPARRAGFSMSAAMAMSLGKAVLARELPSLRELGVPDVSMEFFEGDDDAYYRAMDMLSAPVYLETLGAAAKTRAEDYLSLDRCAREFRDLIRDIVTKS